MADDWTDKDIARAVLTQLGGSYAASVTMRDLEEQGRAVDFSFIAPEPAAPLYDQFSETLLGMISESLGVSYDELSRRFDPGAHASELADRYAEHSKVVDKMRRSFAFRMTPVYVGLLSSLIGNLHRPNRVPSKGMGRVGTRRAWKRAHPPRGSTLLLARRAREALLREI